MFHIEKTSHPYPLQGFAEEATLNTILPTEQTISQYGEKGRKTVWHAVIQKPFIFSPSLSSEEI